MANETHKEGKEISSQDSFLKKEWALITVLLLPFLLIAIVWNTLPDQIPIHWNIRGEVNKWGDKSSVFEIPLVNIGIALLLYFIRYIDPKKRNYDLFPRAFRMVRLAVAAFMFAIFLLTISPALGITVDVNTFVFIAVPLLFLIIGNFMRNFRQNFFAGIRTPWTLNSGEVWERTHKFAAWLWTGGSIVIILLELIIGKSQYFPYIFLGYAGVLVVIPMLMSYIYYKQLPPESK